MGPSGADAAALLAAERVRAAGRVAALAREFDAIVAASAGANTDDEHDPEGATIAFERQQVATLLDQARQHLADLDRAAARLHDGTYGTCTRCGTAIPPARLRARPTATTCIPCTGPDGPPDLGQRSGRYRT